MTVMPRESVDGALLTRVRVTVRSISGHFTLMETTNITIDIGVHSVKRTAATCPNSELGVIALLSFDICNAEHLKLLLICPLK